MEADLSFTPSEKVIDVVIVWAGGKSTLDFEVVEVRGIGALSEETVGCVIEHGAERTGRPAGLGEELLLDELAVGVTNSTAGVDIHDYHEEEEDGAAVCIAAVREAEGACHLFDKSTQMLSV